MECTAAVVRERKKIGRFPGDKTEILVQFYCPILGEIVLGGERAERALEKLKERDGVKSFLEQ